MTPRDRGGALNDCRATPVRASDLYVLCYLCFVYFLLKGFIMKLQVISVLDRAVNVYSRPVFVQAIGQAMRSFMDEANRDAAENTMHAHPKDFALFHLGEFDEETGRFENLELPVRLLEAIDCFKGEI